MRPEEYILENLLVAGYKRYLDRYLKTENKAEFVPPTLDDLAREGFLAYARAHERNVLDARERGRRSMEAMGCQRNDVDS
jgi:hypothetical protein